MTRRILLGAVLVIGVLAVFMTPALWKTLTDSARVNTVAHNIADFDLPGGYQADYAVEFLGYSIAAYKSGERGHLVLMQAPAGVELDEGVFAGYVANDQRSSAWMDATVLNTEHHTVRNQPATITTSERTNSDGQQYLQLNMVFAGKQGAALLVINQPTSRLDRKAIEAFIASVH